MARPSHTHSSPTEPIPGGIRPAGSKPAGSKPAASKPPASRQIIVGAGLLLAVAAIAYFGSKATMGNTEGWYKEANKVAWNPPSAVFAPVWSVLYFVIALCGFLIWRRGYRGANTKNAEQTTLWLYAVQLLLNAMWTPLFFAGYPELGEPAWWGAMAVIVALIASVIWLIARTWHTVRVVAYLLVPYLLWLIYASTLNAGIIALN